MQKSKLLFFGLLIIICMFSKISIASHVIGYDLAWVNIKNSQGNPTDTYKLRLKFYRDVTGIAIPTSFSFNMRENGGDHNVVGSAIIVNKINPQTILSYSEEECAPREAQLKIEYGLYESAAINMANLTYSNGYYLSCAHPSRNIGIINVLGNSSIYTLLMTMDIPRLSASSIYRYNSSPEFKKIPLTYFCVGKPATIDFQVEDIDGDSLVFSLAQPLDYGSTKPFYTIPYASGYNINFNIIDGAPDLTINPRTGIVNFIPTRAGRYLVAFKCEEYRNGVKIGEIRREFQMETVICNEEPPITKVNDSLVNLFIDTIYYGEYYKLNFKSIDNPFDSLFMYIMPSIIPGENVLDPIANGATWKQTGGSAGSNLIIEGLGTVEGDFEWTPKCNNVRELPYTFTVVTRDETCPNRFYDSTFVKLYISKRANNQPYFVSPDTILNYVSKNYYINERDKIQLVGDSILKTYDIDSPSLVNISMLTDVNNGNVNSAFVFNSYPDSVQSTATFEWQTTCDDDRELPYKVKFIARDSECNKFDSAVFEINIYVNSLVNALPITGDTEIVDTNNIYTYSTINQPNHFYYWYGDDVEILSAQGNNSVNVKWKELNHNKLNCIITSLSTACADTSMIDINLATGIEDELNSNYKIYPNPSSDLINIEGININESNKLSLYDIHGKLILEKYITDNTTIDISSLESGIYFIKLKDTYSKVIKL